MTTDIRWLEDDLRPVDARASEAARARQDTLTKPPGSLGDLEALAIRLAGWQRRECPRMERVHITVFAGDHGIAAEGVSAFPQAVTVEMLRNFARGGAAISVLARSLGAAFEVVNLGTVSQVAGGAHDTWLGPGTASFAQGPAEQEEAPDDEAGLAVTVIGRPNVGKSTLINRLLGEERLIAS
ncbi:MAG: nicotinate-nucleotide--dimethylbenzimidazole phosphoribosyltransferase, partial [Steroidobacteraceae bacterium]